MMNCLEVTRVAGEFLDRRLRFRERLGVLAHIAMCRGCRTYIDQLRLALLGLRSLPTPAGAREPQQAVIERFRRKARRE